MKKFAKMLPMLFVVSVICLTVVKKIHAGTQYNWGTATGVSWTTPDDTVAVKNQWLQIGNTTTTVAAVSTPTFNTSTIAVIKASTPTQVGNVVFCLDCTMATLCISTSTAGSENGGTLSYVTVGSSAPTNTRIKCN